MKNSIIGFFVLVALICIKIWHSTIVIYRAALPLDEIYGWNESFLSHSILFPINVKIISNDLSLPRFEDMKIPGYHIKFISSENADIYFHIFKGDSSKLFISNKDEAVFLTVSSLVHIERDIRKVLEQLLTIPILSDNSGRSLAYSDSYQFMFSLLNGRTDTETLNWDAQSAIQSYFLPFLSEIQSLSKFKVYSQIQQYAYLKIKPSFKDQKYKITEEMLPYFVNSGEWNLASSILRNTEINYILYVPHESISPLEIEGNELFNGFSIPRWGGIIILNDIKYGNISKEELKLPIELFISQTKDLLGIDEIRCPTMDEEISLDCPKSPTGISKFELKNTIRKRMVENMVNSISLLKSLARTLEKMTNILVEDRTREDVTESLLKLQRTFDYFNENSLSLQEAFEESKNALKLADKAFYDHRMMGMLYFPDEHLYAIYAPLFVPLVFPLLLSIFKVLKEIKKQGRKEKKD